MNEGLFALAGVALGAILGLVTNALIERWRHSYIRNDARTDRRAATLREALDGYNDFMLAWALYQNRVATGTKVDLLDPAIVAGAPGITHKKLVAVNERIHIESIRHRVGLFIESVVVPVQNGTVTAKSIDVTGVMGTQLGVDIGTELRRLEAQ
jgi:hypothetical protein